MPALQRYEQFPSVHLPDPRDIVVYIPPGYDDEPARQYPVLYLNDGQNLFDADEAYVPGETWQVAERADALILGRKVEPLIIVGVHHAGTKRITEYTPTTTRRLGGGQADAYGRLLVQELKPFIDATYRTRADAEHTGLGGSSLGGLVTLHIGLRHADVFRRLAVLSPSVWWDRRVILREVREARPRPPLRIWLDIGTAEGRRALDDVRLLRAGLEKAGWVDGVDLRYAEYEGARHAETAWAARFGETLAWLFPAHPSIR